ncbi:MAG: hypothetical protein ACREBC_01200 [Pyrinomonadaceae bacterium]
MSRPLNPLHDLILLQDRMNRLFEDATARRPNVETEQSEMENIEWYPAADFYDSDGKYLIALDLPGIDRAALEINKRFKPSTGMASWRSNFQNAPSNKPNASKSKYPEIRDIKAG